MFMAGERRLPRKGFASTRKRISPSAFDDLAAAPEPSDRKARERELLDAARAGDARALDQVVRRLADSVYRFGQSFCRDRDDAEDVSQEVLTALVRTLPRFRGESSLSSWAWIVARRACVRYRRHSRRMQGLDAHDGRLDREPQDRSPGPETELERHELGVALERAIASLPPSSREVIVLRDVEALPAARVAKLLGIEVRAVKSRLHRARVALRASLAEHAGRETPRNLGCPDTVRILSRHLEGDVRADLCAKLEAHVSSCSECAQRCAQLREMLGACRRWGRAPAPRALRKRLKEMLRQNRRDRSVSKITSRG
jgi:RNA polymerase sigma-70 factor (ECF subfamily)